MKIRPTSGNSRRSSRRTRTNSLNVYSSSPPVTVSPINIFSHSGSEHASGMMQYVIWTALEAEGMGVNLQHYNPPIDTRLETEYGVPPTWSLKSQMVFGKPTGQPGKKTFKPIEERMKVVE